MLDDILSALDVHTAQWVVEKCFKGDLIQGRTVVLVTHNIALASPIARFVVSIGPDGKIASQGSVSDALNQNKALLAEYSEQEPGPDVTVEPAEGPAGEKEKQSGKLISAEDIVEGHVGIPACESI